MTNSLNNPADRQKLKTMLAEITHAMQRMDDERESIKEIVNVAAGEFGVDKKIVKKIAKTMYKHNYGDLQAEQAHFEELYETIVESKKP
jgi:Transcriptional regulator DsbA